MRNRHLYKIWTAVGLEILAELMYIGAVQQLLFACTVFGQFPDLNRWMPAGVIMRAGDG